MSLDVYVYVRVLFSVSLHGARCERDYCNDAELRAVADAMASNGMRDAGYQYINVDGRWQWQGG